MIRVGNSDYELQVFQKSSEKSKAMPRTSASVAVSDGSDELLGGGLDIDGWAYLKQVHKKWVLKV